ncbi:presenilin [Anaeramoeba ignava]|uniref:Presenilin n=1 Tax=Anaeramoeba ignava TaxID=1746090 RepID=A0A9Q0RGP5_ANAIG|nr:presenilin [Anaeramoeba ignava]
MSSEENLKIEIERKNEKTNNYQTFVEKTSETEIPSDSYSEFEFADYVDFFTRTTKSILVPVALSMVIVVFFLQSIYLQNQITSQEHGIRDLTVYHQNDSDSFQKYFFGSFLNAIIVISIIFGSTALLILFLKFGWNKILYIWLLLTTFVVLTLFTANCLLEIDQVLNFGIDWISFFIIVFNFSIVGIFVIFIPKSKRINQFYLICFSSLLAIEISKLPELTTWILLIVLALYDLIAVLTPNGPLQILIQESIKKNQPLPSLIYSSSLMLFTKIKYPIFKKPEKNIQNIENTVNETLSEITTLSETDNISTETISETDTIISKEKEKTKEQEKAEVKLGVGDFVFYSVLISRACFYGYLTVFTCFFAILMGLTLTLFLLAFYRKILPALPLSILIGICFYFLTNFVLSNFVKNITINQFLV